jgi:nucleoside-triphosphatase
VGSAFLLTGRPGVGKTTVVRTVVARLGARAGGFYTEEIRRQGRRVGFRLVSLEGPTGTLASVDISSRYRVGKYRVDLDDLERVGVDALRRAVAQPEVAIVVIDEIGKMELFSAAFREQVEAALHGNKPVLATVMAGAHAWVDTVKSRPSATLVEVTLANRDALPQQILDWLRGMTVDSKAHYPTHGG